MRQHNFSIVLRRAWLAAIAGGCLSSPALAQTTPPPAPHAVAAPGTGIVVTLDSGEVIRGRLVERTESALKINSPLFGELVIPSGRITASAFEPAPAADGSPAPLPPPPPPPPAAEPPPPSEDELSFFDGWTGSVAGGLNGSDGNTETLNFRVGAGAKRVTDLMATSADIYYQYAENDGVKSQSRAEGNVRNDWNFGKESPWLWFARGTAEFDEFQSWNWRLSAFTGPGYRVIRSDTTNLVLRAGAGATKELGGSARNELIPEALLGVDFDHKLDDRQKFFITSEYLPSLIDFPEFRWNTRAGYEFLVDAKSKLTFRLGLENRYESDPGPDQDRNDIDYFALLAWSF